MSVKVLCSNDTLICELAEHGLFIHIFGDKRPVEVIDYLDGFDYEEFVDPLDSDTVYGILVRKKCALEAIESLVDGYDLVIQ